MNVDKSVSMPFIGNKQYSDLEELEEDAKARLSASAYGYYASGSETQTTVRENRDAFNRLRLLPRCLHDVRYVDTTTHIFDQRLSMPVLVAPMAMQKLCHEQGELAMARAATSVGVPMIVSTFATCSIEEVGSCMDSPFLWFQIYVLTRRDVTAKMVREAEALGYKALVVTVDAPRLGRRYEDERQKLSLPPHLSLKNLESINKLAGQTSHETPDRGNKFGQHFSKFIDDGLTWEFISWLKSVTRLPVLIKGVLAPDDAKKAVEIGVSGIIVSNHGGRQLDFAPAAIDVLPLIATAVNKRIPILVDGGIRRGTDVVKSIALGADAVLIGRPMLWALTLGGEQGVNAALSDLKSDIELAMALLGCRKIDDITEGFVMRPHASQYIVHPSRL